MFFRGIMPWLRCSLPILLLLSLNGVGVEAQFGENFSKITVIVAVVPGLNGAERLQKDFDEFTNETISAELAGLATSFLGPGLGGALEGASAGAGALGQIGQCESNLEITWHENT